MHGADMLYAPRHDHTIFHALASDVEKTSAHKLMRKMGHGGACMTVRMARACPVTRLTVG